MLKSLVCAGRNYVIREILLGILEAPSHGAQTFLTATCFCGIHKPSSRLLKIFGAKRE